MADVLERGNVYFFYRPRVQVAVARGVDDVQRLYMVWHPRGGRYRLIIVGEKRLPALDRRGDRKTWGFVQKVGRQPEDVEDELDPRVYDTKTRGERHAPAARPAGEGIYAIVRHDDHTHWAYALELPEAPEAVQRALNIAREGSYIVSVKNSEAPPGLGLDETRRSRLPEHLRERFRARRFIDLDPPEFLDYEGTEILLIGASRDVARELGIELRPRREALATAEIFRDLRVERSLHPVTPLVEGTWA